ncbi:hypothetical protein K490DRAFT_64803 [Saccharata proteae CBS 121410]|uniref:Uncharacterized protein n=1 Tax=Saccharata proteae CBS 121410 TaxID=1314787 RepID=A0A9P4HY01_9PEZI|nr:hypothetical protein K490DRAFT_64803 [Saccharata proteae CBS 121410]
MSSPRSPDEKSMAFTSEGINALSETDKHRCIVILLCNKDITKNTNWHEVERLTGAASVHSAQSSFHKIKKRLADGAKLAEEAPAEEAPLATKAKGSKDGRKSGGTVRSGRVAKSGGAGRKRTGGKKTATAVAAGDSDVSLAPAAAGGDPDVSVAAAGGDSGVSVAAGDPHVSVADAAGGDSGVSVADDAEAEYLARRLVQLVSSPSAGSRRSQTRRYDTR